jgi:hypothetical protein
MTSRKQTPDVLSEILGGEPSVPEPKPTPKPQPVPKRRTPAKKPGPRSTRNQPKWEYMEVIFRDYGGYRPRYVNGQEQRGWKQAPTIYEYLGQIGEDGWELVGVGGRDNREMPAYFKRRK